MKALKYFKVTSKKSLTDIICLFSEFDDAIESEIKSLFAFLFFQSKANIRLNLGSVHHIPVQLLFRLLEFGRELKADGRGLELINSPKSLIRYTKRFHLEQIVRIVVNQS